MDELPAPLEGLRAGQLGIVVIGRVIIGDIAVTLVDLAQRGLLQVRDADGGDWLLTPGAVPTPVSKPEPLLEYEEKLLGTLAKAGASSRLSSMPAGFGKHLDKVRDALVSEAVRRGWVHRLHHDQRTPECAVLASHVRSFQRQLRRLASEPGQDGVTGGLLPYALHFGLVRDEAIPLVRFAHAWVQRFMTEPGWSQPVPDRPKSDELDLSSDREMYMARQMGEAAFLW